MTKARELAELGTTLSVDGSGNADLAGILTTDGLTVNGAVALQSTTTGGHVVSGVTVDLAAEIKGVTGYGNLRVLFDPSTKDSYILGAYNGGDIHLSRRNASVNYKSLSIDASTGDISFYEDTGTTAKLFWDASAEALGIGTTSPTSPLTVVNSTGGFTATFRNSVGSGTQSGLLIDAGSTSADFALYARNAAASSDLFAIKGNGNVGIGTSSPAEGIHLARSNATALIESTDGTQATLDLKNTEGHFIIGNDGGSLFVFDQTDTAERFRIDTSGNVGIGTSSPATKLEVNSGSANEVAQFISTDGTAYLSIKDSGTTSDLNGIGTIGDTLVMWGGGSERMRIDASGNLLVGKTSADNTTVGTTIYGGSSASVSIVRSGASQLILNRLSTDGDMAVFRKDGTTVGSIGVDNSQLVVTASSSNLVFENPTRTMAFSSGALAGAGASNDAVIDLGISNRRFKNLYLSGGVYLGGTGAANLLDDYEVGTYTPEFVYGTSIVYTSQLGWYRKVGDIVFCQVDITISSKGSDASQVHVSLPFAGATENANMGISGSIDYYLSSLVPSTLNSFQPTNGSFDAVRFNGQGGLHTYNSLNASGRLIAGFVYRTSA